MADGKLLKPWAGVQIVLFVVTVWIIRLELGLGLRARGFKQACVLCGVLKDRVDLSSDVDPMSPDVDPVSPEQDASKS